MNRTEKMPLQVTVTLAGETDFGEVLALGFETSLGFMLVKNLF